MNRCPEIINAIHGAPADLAKFRVLYREQLAVDDILTGRDGLRISREFLGGPVAGILEKPCGKVVSPVTGHATSQARNSAVDQTGRPSSR